MVLEVALGVTGVRLVFTLCFPVVKSRNLPMLALQYEIAVLPATMFHLEKLLSLLESGQCPPPIEKVNW